MNTHLTGHDVKPGQVWKQEVATPANRQPAVIAEVNDGEVRFADRTELVSVGSLLAYWRYQGWAN